MPVALSNSLANTARKLSANDAHRVWTFLDRFWDNPAHPSLSLERISKIKTDNLWTGRISNELRAVIHKEKDMWTVLYVGHHDSAYDWAKNRTIERHIKTGALQVIREPQEFTTIAKDALPEKPKLLDEYEDSYLLELGVPPSWLAPLKEINCKNILLNAVLDLPEAVAERLLDLIEGKQVQPPKAISLDQPAILSSDTQRQFIVLNDNHDLVKLLEAPLATWITFLHPSQKNLATGNFKGAIKITGAAGTGKTVVGLHRARHLARQGKRVLLTTFVTTLCRNLEHNLQTLCTAEELSQITVINVHRLAKELVNQGDEYLNFADEERIKALISDFYSENCPLSHQELYREWEEVIQTQGITQWNEYQKKHHRKIKQDSQQKQVWNILKAVLNTLEANHEADWSGICRHARDLLRSGKISSPFDSVIVDEIQDLRPPEIQFLAALAGTGNNRLMVLGDAGQRIYGSKYSLKALGIAVQGRSYTLKINYRTTEQIRQFADQIIGDRDDLNGQVEIDENTVSLFCGPPPELRKFTKTSEELEFIAQQIKVLVAEGINLGEIAVFTRTNNGLTPIEGVLADYQIAAQRLTRETGPNRETVNIGTLHRSKGLEFKVVFIVNASDQQIPLAYVLSKTPDRASHNTVLEREKSLLYVSITRARDKVFISWVGTISRFLSSGS